jgi:hypothetical protein
VVREANPENFRQSGSIYCLDEVLGNFLAKNCMHKLKKHRGNFSVNT